MASLPSQLNLSSKPSGVSKTIDDFLLEVASIGSSLERLSRIQDFMETLIKEKKKSEMLGLHLSNSLLTDALEILKEACNQHQEITPWMSSSQFGTGGHMHEPNQGRQTFPVANSTESSKGGSAEPGLSLDLNEEIPFPDLPAQQQVPVRKRKVWSPVLHQQFLNCLEQLGGPEVATAKKIQAMMQVDGLTYNEVKSHLQNYRLQIKRRAVGIHSGNSGSTSGSSGNVGASSNVDGASQ